MQQAINFFIGDDVYTEITKFTDYDMQDNVIIGKHNLIKEDDDLINDDILSEEVSDEVTHEQFFGENIRRVIRGLSN